MSNIRTTLRFVALILASQCVSRPADGDSALIQLSRLKSHMRAEVAGLPNYTCLETIRRFRRPFGRLSKLTLLDTVRLEIASSGGREWYGSPEARELSEQNPAKLAAGGMIANGLFATTWHNLFAIDRATFAPLGETYLNGVRTLKYSFRLSNLLKPYTVSIGGASGDVGEEGFFFADAETLDILRLEIRVTDIPPGLPLSEMESTVSLARTQIGNSNGLIPQQAELHALELEGEDYDRIDFTHCRAFQTSSSISFASHAVTATDRSNRGPASPSPRAEPKDGLPALLAVTIELTKPVTGTDPVGELISGRVVGDVVHKGHLLIENGAPVSGRLRRLNRPTDGAFFAVGIEFVELQAGDAVKRFYADLIKIEKTPQVRVAFWENVQIPGRHRDSILKLPELPGVASFFVEGKRLNLPPGFRMVWRTRGPIRGLE
jgi:hypothetical protein